MCFQYNELAGNPPLNLSSPPIVCCVGALFACYIMVILRVEGRGVIDLPLRGKECVRVDKT